MNHCETTLSVGYTLQMQHPNPQIKMESGLDDFQHLDMTWYEHFGVPCEILQGANAYKARYQFYGHILILALHVPARHFLRVTDG